jgi:hypothetical protein
MPGVGPGLARADQPPLDLAGQPFYFSATCTGLGDVILVNQSLARAAALRVVGTQTVIIQPLASKGGEQGIGQHFHANGTCSLTRGGLTIETIEPFEEPIDFPVMIVNG